MKQIIVLIVLLVVCASPASAAIKACLACNSTCNTMPGSNATATANYTFTLPSGSSATVVNVGTTSDALFDFGIPTGANGADGAYGAPGAPGAANMTMNLTPNMTMNQTPGPNNDPWYAWINGTRAFTGKINLGGFNISNVLDPVTTQDAATRGWTLSQINSSPSGGVPDQTQFLFLNGTRAMTGRLNATQNISGITIIIGTTDATNKSYVDARTDMSWNASYRTAAADDTQDEAINSSMRQNVSTYVIAVNTSMRNNISANYNTISQDATQDEAINTSMRNNVSANHAGLVGGKVPTVQLGGAGADATTYLRGDQTWVAPPGGGGDTSSFAFTNGTRPFNRVNLTGDANITGITAIIGSTDAVNKSYVDTKIYYRGPVTIEGDFMDASTDAVPGLLGVAISSGTTAGVATTAAHPGVAYLRDSTTANGGYRIGCSGSQLIAGGERYEVIFQSVGTRITQHARMGWSDSTAGSTMPTDGVYFNITNKTGVAGGKFNLSGVTASNSARSSTSTNYTLTDSTWYRGTIEVNPAASLVTYTLYADGASGAQLWQQTLATNIPTGAGRDTSPCIIAAETTTDAAADILRLDYAKWSIDRVLAR